MCRNFLAGGTIKERLKDVEASERPSIKDEQKNELAFSCERRRKVA